MAVTFLDPGGDADFGTALWSSVTGAPAIATDFVHGGHQRSVRIRPGNADSVIGPNAQVADAGGRISFWLYLVANPTTADVRFVDFYTVGVGSVICGIHLTSGGLLRLWNAAGGAQIGSNGPQVTTGKWHRISLAYTITDTTHNSFRLYLDGALAISVTNATLTATGTSLIRIGNANTDATLDYRISDIYTETDSSLTDPGNIWCVAKRSLANGSLNEWTTQIGVSGSGYGSGHAPQVNERALSITNGWSIQNAAKKTEEYSVEGRGVGDIDITTASVIDWMGWVWAKVGSNSTGNIIVGGVATNVSVTTTAKAFRQMAGSAVYPAGNTDIGMDTNTVNQLFSLYECGVVVAYKPGGTAQVVGQAVASAAYR